MSNHTALPAIVDEFQVHLLNEQGLEKAEQIARVLSVALTGLRSLVGDPRSIALVTTKLQEAGFFAKRGMAIDPANQVAPSSGSRAST